MLYLNTNVDFVSFQEKDGRLRYLITLKTKVRIVMDSNYHSISNVSGNFLYYCAFTLMYFKSQFQVAQTKIINVHPSSEKPASHKIGCVTL